MCDPSIPLTTLEYPEWGNPSIPAERAVIASYCPYTNVRSQAYPAMLVRESINTLGGDVNQLRQALVETPEDEES